MIATTLGPAGVDASGAAPGAPGALASVQGRAEGRAWEPSERADRRGPT